MKRLVFIWLLFLSYIFAESLEINEYKSDIYYGNGIMTTRYEAEFSLEQTLNPAILKQVYNSDKEKMKKFHQFVLSYNYSAKEDFGNTPIAMVLDLMESYEVNANNSKRLKA